MARASLAFSLLAQAVAQPTCSGGDPAACQADQEDVGLLQVGQKGKQLAVAGPGGYCTPNANQYCDFYGSQVPCPDSGVCPSTTTTTPAPTPAPAGSWTKHSGYNCYAPSHGASNSAGPYYKSLAQCEQSCTDAGGLVMDSAGVTCWCAWNVDLSQCVTGSPYSTWLLGASLLQVEDKQPQLRAGPGGACTPNANQFCDCDGSQVACPANGVCCSTPAPTPAPAGSWTKHSGYNCYAPSHGASNSAGPYYKSLAQCEQTCTDAGGLVMDSAGVTCWCAWNVDLSKCVTGSPYSTWLLQ